MNQPFSIADPSYLGTAGIPMVWWGSWAEGHRYPRGAVVTDGNFTMIANAPTEERAAPQPIGEEIWVYTGSSPTGSITAKTLIVANTYTLPVSVFITAYRVYTITGNDYSIVLRRESTGVVSPLISFRAGSTGWRTFQAAGNIYPAGASFTLGVYVVEPDPTPVNYVLSYDYQTPNNETAPAVGVINHANRTMSSFRINKTGQGGQDNSTDLGSMTAGDTIDGAGMRWSITNVTDNGTWIDFTVAPATQGSPDGVQDFTFETVTATPIVTVIDPDYYLNDDRVQPFYSIDSGDEVFTDNGYGIDLEYQEANVSEDWDVISTAGAS